MWSIYESIILVCKLNLIIIYIVFIIVAISNTSYCIADEYNTKEDKSKLDNSMFERGFGIDKFVFSGFSPKTSDNMKGPKGGWIKNLSKDRFTFAGPWYGSKKIKAGEKKWYMDIVLDCIKSDIKMIFPLVPHRTITDTKDKKYHGAPGTSISIANLNSYGDDEVADADDKQIDAWINDVEEQIKDVVVDEKINSVVAIWYIMPEEMRYWKKRELELLRRMCETVKKIDPKRRPAMMYEPQHSSKERLKWTIPYQDILTIGIYPHYSGNDWNRVQVRHAMAQILKTIEDTNSTALPAPTLEMFEDNDHPYANSAIPWISRFVRHDVYCAFANGAKGILVWSMGRRTGFKNYSKFYGAWADVSKELYELGLRDVFINGAPTNSAKITVTSGEEYVRFKWNKKIETYPTVSVRDWLYKDKVYILIVNSSDKPVGFTLDGVPEGEYRALFVGDTVVVNSLEAIILPPLGTMMLTQYASS